MITEMLCDILPLVLIEIIKECDTVGGKEDYENESLDC